MTVHSSIVARTRVARVLQLGVLAGLTIALACGTDGAPGPLQPSGPLGRVRFVNLITDPARVPVNAILEGVPFGVNLGYTAATPATLPAPATVLYSSILAGDRTVVLKRTADTSVTVASLTFTVGEGQDRTVFAIGGTGATPVTAFVTTDDNAAPAAGQTRVRIVHLSPSAGNVDIFVTAVGADLATATPSAANVAYQGMSAYLALASGTYQIRAVPAGTAPASRAANVIINLASVAFPSGSGRTVVTADNNTGGAPRRAFVLSDR